MDYEENMVEMNDIPDGDLPEEVVEESEDSAESLESVMDEEGEEESTEQEQPEEKQQGTGGEPGWFKSRWNKEVGKLSEQIRNEVRNEYEAKFAPIQERLFEMDAQELVKSGKVKDIETARELVRYRNGREPQAAEKPEKARNDKGQYESREKIAREARTDARIKELQKQAEKIRAKGGPDVIAEFQSNEKIKQAVVSGDMDFYDVADQMKAPKKRSPAPVRSSNGASGQTPNAIESMSKEQFARMEKKIAEGARYSLK